MIHRHALTAEQQQRNFEIGREYNRMTTIRHNQLSRDLSLKMQLKEAAIAALPTETLKAQALVSDFSLVPYDRWVPTWTPPIEGYDADTN